MSHRDGQVLGPNPTANLAGRNRERRNDAEHEGGYETNAHGI